MFTRIRTLWRGLRRRAEWERELEEELRSHVERRAEDLMRTGVPQEEAERRARMELGARGAYREQCREAYGLRWADELRQDLRYSSRILRRSPGFTAVAILSLALGIGANTAVFSIMSTLVLRPLPVSSPGELYFLQGSNYPANSFPNYRDIRDRSTAFSGLIGYRLAQMGLGTGSGAHRVWGYLATGNYFDVLGVRPALGRFFHAEDDLAPNASPYAVLSYACWQSRFAADPQIVGKAIRISSLPYTVLGVAPRGFQGTEVLIWPEIWVPMMMQPSIEGHPLLESRGTFNTWVTGRLKPGITRRQAEAELNAIAADLARDFPKSNEGLKLSLAKPGLVGDKGRIPVKAFWNGVMALAGMVLLAACANLASLLAARATDRYREIAIRVSIGAGRGRIVRQLLTESVLLSVFGGAAGCGLAAVLLRLLSQWRAPLDFPVQFEVYPDARVFAFAAAVSLATGILFGIAPVRDAWTADPNQAIKGAASQSKTGRRWALRDLLLAGQVALCCVLVAACFVAFRGLGRALATPLGFDPRGAAVAGFDLGLAGYKAEAGQTFQQRALDAVARLPGVSAAAYSSTLPLSIDQSTTTVFQEGTTDFGSSKGKTAAYYEVSPGYFRAIGTRLLAGRDFTWHDDRKAPRVALVNETFARTVAGKRNAVGSRFLHGDGSPVEIIGVVEDGKYTTLTETPRPALFRAALQSYNSTTVLIVRSMLPEPEMAMQMRNALAALDPQLPAHGVGSVEQMLGIAYLPARAAAVALSAFGVLAIMLATTGIYGMASYAVSRRVREIGIRVAVGARPGQVLRFVLGRTALLLCAGSCLGLALGIAAAQVLANVVYQASSSDPVVLGAVAVTMVSIALASVWAPARRALSIDPSRALRHE